MFRETKRPKSSKERFRVSSTKALRMESSKCSKKTVYLFYLKLNLKTENQLEHQYDQTWDKGWVTLNNEFFCHNKGKYD